ncbi:hypothetical protein ACTTAF_13365 [Rhodobacter capsulatus]|uniref:hypothetical protein n=1 Tax=Rhodobacter capsulatus TaxID=1061 RepID=UPI0003D38012|nr:hypothetical protein [Rhodobacter capsulatus]ETD86372.1 hypothetical protein U703_00525 [Rhodobacter capsulatus YW1]
MTEAAKTRADLKRACLAMLDAVAIEHPAGHQGVYVARYLLVSRGGDRIGLMFEKGERSAANLWLARRFASALPEAGIVMRDYPASALHQLSADGKERSYGRHSALKSMRDLANVDLVRFTIERPTEMRLILDGLAEL